MNEPPVAVVELERYLVRLEGRRYLPPALGRHLTSSCSSCGCAIAAGAIACTSDACATLDLDLERKGVPE